MSNGNLTVNVDDVFLKKNVDQTTNARLTATEFIGALSGNALTAANALTSGTVTAAAQPNITSVGTLTSLAVTGNIGINTTDFTVNTANGHVGIGTDDPKAMLHIHNSDTTDAGIKVEAGGDKIAELLLCEDPFGEFGFALGYIGGNNDFEVISKEKTGGVESINTRLRIERGNGNAFFSSDLTCNLLHQTSDDRVKYNESSINTLTALNVINQLNPQTYEKISELPSLTGNWIPTDAEWETEKNQTVVVNNEDGTDVSVPKWRYVDEIGLIAQDVKNIPELAVCVNGEEIDANGTQTPLRINYSMIATYHISATKELTTQLNAEKAKTALLESKVATLETEVAQIKTHLSL